VSDQHYALFDKVPDGFLDCPADRLASILPGPSLIDLPGRGQNPLFLSVLLHGNENSGLLAVQNALRRHADRLLPRGLLLFVGNVKAAAAHVRTLPEQADFNRVWPGTLTPDAPEAIMAQEVFDYVASRNPFASIDIHNNTGFNPHYSCITRLEPEFIALARLFSRIVVHFQRPAGVQAGAFARLCPAITVECGKAGGGGGVERATELIEAALALEHFPEHAPAPHDVELLRTYAIVKTPAQASFTFDGSPADFRFRGDIDHLNFSELPAGESFGMADGSLRLELHPGDEEAAPGEYFDYADGEIRLARPAVPAMLTLDDHAVRLDCLCYLMHRISSEGTLLP
jgi:succinylglutamate desuccinylase